MPLETIDLGPWEDIIANTTILDHIDHVKEVVIQGRLVAVCSGYVSGQNGSCSEDLATLWGIIL